MAKIENRIRVVLAEQDMTIKDLADATGMHYTTMHRIVRGKALSISFDQLARICKALDVQPGDILKYVPNEDEI